MCPRRSRLVFCVSSMSSRSLPARAVSEESTTSCNLAPGFGILDADIYGPSQPKLFGLRGKPRIASIFDCALHGPSQPRYSLLFKPGLSLHPNSTSPARMWEWEKLRTVFWKCLHRLCHRALPS